MSVPAPSALRSTNTGAPPSSCAMTSKHTCLPGACAQAQQTESYTHTHIQTVQSWKFRKNSHFPLVAPTDLDQSRIMGFSKTYSVSPQGH